MYLLSGQRIEKERKSTVLPLHPIFYLSLIWWKRKKLKVGNRVNPIIYVIKVINNKKMDLGLGLAIA